MVHGKKLVIDAKGHIVGRLAAYVAKSLREGYSVVLLRAEGTIFSSPIDRMVSIYKDKKRKRCLVNPKKGPFHYKEPSKCLKRVVRGMLNYKGARGAEDYARLKVYDGIPMEYELVERVVVTQALAETKLNPVTKTSTMGQLCERMGWTSAGLLEKFESERLKRVAVAEKEKEMKNQKKSDLVSSDAFKRELDSILANIE
ncbi:large subunit ribosomal protein L13Ae [Nematocida minor]|uniref:large subunit ribosomal protein L13Ae n=1 Tax=Nematocida minor TaxID=1912983 RepID=UPI00221EC231|nr:large subunit ribosomal protein L13Ae [Nematocida minor]KAI5192831.1 large subunit ribosomal protein L13Ae [Nematocida minor]